MDVPAPSYITADDVQENSQVTGLVALNTEQIELLITIAEGHIDDYVGRQPHHPYDSNIDRVFPREQDFSIVIANGIRYEYPQTPIIPYDVQRACLLQVEWLFLQWWPNRATTQPGMQHAVLEQSIGGDGSYAEKRATGGIDFSAASLCDQAKAVLANGYRSRWAQMSTTDVRTSPAPRQ